MRIAVVTPGFSASEEDWCIPALLHLVRRLAVRHDVQVLALRYPHDRREYDVSGARVVALGGANAAGLRRAPLLLRAVRRMVAESNRQRFDVIHGLWADEPGFIAVAAGALTRTPAVVSVMGGELSRLPDIGYGGQLNPLNRWLARVSLRRAARVSVGSDYQRTITKPFVANRKLNLSPLGVDTNLVSPGRTVDTSVHLDGSPALLSVASLVPIKDHAASLHAFARLRIVLPAARLHLVGDGALRENLGRLAISLGIGHAVTFHGNVRHERLPDYYRAADIFLLNSRHESQGLAPLEAAACGLPIVGMAVGVMPELDPSAVPPPADPAGIARRIVTLWHDRAERERRSAAGLRLVHQRYSLDRTVERLDSLYRQTGREAIGHSGRHEARR